MKKAFSLLLCLVLMLGVLAVPALGEEPITLYMVESLTSPARSAVLQEIIAAFEAEHPNIHIELVSPPLETADQKIYQMLANGSDIDILEVRDINVGMMTANEYVIPLDDYVAKWEDAATLSDTVEATATLVGDAYYLIPYGFYRKMMYYRCDWFEEAGIEYFYSLIDDIVARIMKSKGGMIWACKNYDGDVMSDMISSAFGSLAMMTSVLVSPTGVYEYEAAHGTVTRHYYKYLKGEATSTNPMATLFAWTGALRKRAELDELPDLADFADRLEKASVETIESGTITGDLKNLIDVPDKNVVNTEDFLKAIASRL